MGDTYGKVVDNLGRYNLTARTSIFADFMRIIKLDDDFVGNNKYLYIITPLAVEEEAEWVGAFGEMQQNL